jgi:DNA-binding MarR family transcriptional regulator
LLESGFADLRPSHGNVLERLTFTDEVRLSAMAAATGMTAQSLGELVDDLERRGYVKRSEDPADRRAKLVRLTAKGRRSTGAAAESIAGAERRLRKLLGASDYATVRAIVMRIIEATQQRQDDRSQVPADRDVLPPPSRPGAHRVKTNS